MFKKILVPLFLIGATLVAGCSDDDNATNPAQTEAFVRVAHLSPDAPNVDVWVDGARVLQDVPFETFSAYLEVPSGDRRVQVTPTGASSPMVIDATLSLTAGTYYTVAATGLLSSIGAAVLVDDPETTQNGAKIRFVHAGPDAPNVDITLPDGTILFADVAFNEAEGFLTTPGGSYDLQVRVAGTDNVVLSFDNVTLEDGTIYSVFATGLVSDSSLGAIVALDQPGDGSTTVSLP